MEYIHILRKLLFSYFSVVLLGIIYEIPVDLSVYDETEQSGVKYLNICSRKLSETEKDHIPSLRCHELKYKSKDEINEESCINREDFKEFDIKDENEEVKMDEYENDEEETYEEEEEYIDEKNENYENKEDISDREDLSDMENNNDKYLP
ncbi:hypothetical protein PFAG_02212 [Plasmodium falciparum Santa Lucia]|uniref:Uncharacterized protein n=1 Tax=Plasmodium falciparum Santa Lucia TaxID=478859 RepID=W7G0I1_PLAFA|nr:hypothetical protein PFAG_02212 [Plasmodium falciparum Santa Lucia]